VGTAPPALQATPVEGVRHEAFPCSVLRVSPRVPRQPVITQPLFALRPLTHPEGGRVVVEVDTEAVAVAAHVAGERDGPPVLAL
jgi:hypothetical protein